jgi:hypothetical protein
MEGESESEGEFEYVDEELMDLMDNDEQLAESDDEFKTMKESDFGEEDQQYMDGDILQGETIQNDS